MNRRHFIQIGATSILALSANRFAMAKGKSDVDLRIVATTDVHSFLTDFDYYKDAPTDKFGFTRAASLIRQARAEVKNSVLVDNGDLIQGNPIADYQAAQGYKEGKSNPAVDCLNAMNYEVGTLGNHEFNYGLNYLADAIKQAKFPIVNANVVKAGTEEPYFTPYVIQEKSVVDNNGKTHKLKIGYIGFVPPQIIVWDKANLQGKVETRDIVKTAQKYVPEMKKKGADIIVALAHTGPSDEPYKEGAENSAFYLADVPHIDAVIFGHSHRLFPNKEFAKSPNADIVNGTVKGVPESMAGYWANNISVVDLGLTEHKGKWIVTSGKAVLRPIYDVETKKALAKNDPTGYTEVNKGELTFRNAADLYLYPNTLVVVKATGEQLKEWLECSAGMFKQIDPRSDKSQSLIDWEGFRTYNFDVIDGVNYEYDLTKPARYDGECKLINPESHRVMNLTYQGKPVDPKAEFLIATNNYRAYGNKFPGTGDQHIVYASPDENRQILADYIKVTSEKEGSVNPSADKNWRFTPIKGNDKLDVRFETSPSEQAAKFIAEKAQYPMKQVGTDEIGFAVYQIDLSK